MDGRRQVSTCIPILPPRDGPEDVASWTTSRLGSLLPLSKEFWGGLAVSWFLIETNVCVNVFVHS